MVSHGRSAAGRGKRAKARCGYEFKGGFIAVTAERITPASQARWTHLRGGPFNPPGNGPGLADEVS